VQAAAPAEIYRHPASRFVGGFLGTPPMNFLTLPVAEGHVALGNMRIAAPRGPASIVLGIRPEDLDITAGEDGFAFQVQVVEPLGSHTLLTGHADTALVRVMVPPDLRPARGTVLHLRPRSDRITWFDTTSGVALGSTT